MNHEHFSTLSGFLLEHLNEKRITPDLIANGQNISYVGKLLRTNWDIFEINSEIPLRNEVLEGPTSEFKYPLVCRRSGARLLVLSLDKELCNVIVSRFLNPALSPGVAPVNIATHKLVSSLSTDPIDYALTYVHARMPAFGVQLRSVSFYGDDLGEVGFFREHLALMNVLSCGLRLTNSTVELVRLGSDGAVFFKFSNFQKSRLIEIERALSFISNSGYLSSPIHRERDDVVIDLDDWQ